MGVQGVFDMIDTDFLTQKEKKVYTLIFEKKLTTRVTASRLGIGQTMVCKYIKKIRQKLGLKSKGVFKGGVPSGCGVFKNFIKYRYHAVQYRITFHYTTKKFKNSLRKSGKIGNWRYFVYKKCIIVWLLAGKDFRSDSKENIEILALQDFEKIIPKLEQDTGARILKERNLSIELIKHHLANMEAPEFNLVTGGKKIIRFKNSEGQVFLQYDQSTGIKEREFPNIDNRTQAKRIEKQLIDHIENDPLSNSQIVMRMMDLTNIVEKIIKIIGEDKIGKM